MIDYPGGSILTKIFEMYISLMPVIFMGILNMVWVKLPILKVLSKPIDGAKKLKDGNRIFGDNKTWKGLIGYIILGIITTVIWGLVCDKVAYLGEHNYFYINHHNTVSYNLVIGLSLGIAYSLFELPNSFIKRRLKIKEGKTTEGMIKWVFVILDQADSLLGCVLVISFVYRMTILFYFGYVLLGALTHLVINILLYLIHLRKNMF